MRVFKTTYKDRSGQTKEAAKWYVEFRDHNEIKRRLPAFTSREQSDQVGRKLEQLVVFRSNGDAPDLALSRWIEVMPSTMRAKLAEIGMLDARRIAAARALTDHVEEYRQSLEDKDRSEHHVKQTKARVLRLFEDCGFLFWSDIDAQRVERYLAERRKGKKGISLRTSNSYLAAAKAFCRWMVQTSKAPESPLQILKPLNAAVALKRVRRVLGGEDARRLLRATEAAPEHHRMCGATRALVYRLVLETGLRANEVRSLRVSDLQLDGPSPALTIRAANSKHRIEDLVPLRPTIARLLAAHTASMLPNAQPFTLTRRTAAMLRKDLKLVDIPYKDDCDEFLDFHALRHTFITNVARTGTDPKTVQTLARHKTSALTFDRYTHPSLVAGERALDGLPDLDGDDPERLAATGTEGGDVLSLCLSSEPVQQSTTLDNDGPSRHPEPASTPGGVMESVDISDLKSEGLRAVWVRVPPSPPQLERLALGALEVRRFDGLCGSRARSA